MKNKIITAVLAAALAASLAACGDSAADAQSASSAESAVSGDTESTSSSTEGSSSSQAEELETPYADVPVVEGDPAVSECITLADYSEYEFEREQAEITDEELDEQIASLVGVQEVTDENAVVEDGDTVDLAFEGEIDGAPFEGGNSDSYSLVIGSGSFIDGFEDGMLGMKKGESRDLDLVFPEDYHKAELAGKPVVFHVTVNTISRPGTATNAWVTDYTGGTYTTVEEFRESQRESMRASRQASLDDVLRTEIWQKITEESEFLQFPETLIQRGRESYDEINESSATAYGLTLDEFKEAYGLTDEAYEQQREYYARQAAAGMLVLKAVSEREGLDESSAEYTSKLEEVAGEYMMSTDELLETYGEDTVSEYVLERVLSDRLLETIVGE